MGFRDASETSLVRNGIILTFLIDFGESHPSSLEERPGLLNCKRDFLVGNFSPFLRSTFLSPNVCNITQYRIKLYKVSKRLFHIYMVIYKYGDITHKKLTIIIFSTVRFEVAKFSFGLTVVPKYKCILSYYQFHCQVVFPV